MRCSAVIFSVAIATVQAAKDAIPLTNGAIPGINLPVIPVLPLPGVPDVLSGNGLNSLSASLQAAAQALGVNADVIAIANAQLSSNITLSPTPNLPVSLDIVKAVNGATNSFWQLATDLEKKICSIATSITQQNIATQQANLATAIQAQITAVTRLQQNIATVVLSVQSKTAAFSAAEKNILTAAIRALTTAAVASSAPLSLFASGLKSTGIASVTDAANGLSVQANAIATFASGVNFVGA